MELSPSVLTSVAVTDSLEISVFSLTGGVAGVLIGATFLSNPTKTNCI